jgi:23S rRNA (guanine745-N1)-methyltransferase
VWRGLPLADRSAGVVLDVFGPRNSDEIERLLRSDGLLISVTPTANHLRELIDPLGHARH